MDTIDFRSKVILEVGCGPGGNLLHIAQHHFPKRLIGVDISQVMIELAMDNLSRHNIIAELHKIDGVNLPILNRSIDISLTVTVLQHNTDGVMLKSLVREICRVTKTTIVVVEDTGNAGLHGTGGGIARQVAVYKSVFSEHGFIMSDCLYLNIKISRSWNTFIRRRFLSKKHKEGERMRMIPTMIVASCLPITRILDGFFVERKNLTKMVFHRNLQFS